VNLVWRLAAATTLIVLGFSMTGPVLAILLQQAGHGTRTIGAFAMLPFLLVALMIPVIPRVLARWGTLAAYRVGAALEVAGAVGYAWGDGLLVWSLSSVVSGIGAAALWNATEALLAQEAPPHMRGRVMGLYQTALGAALALGPFLPGLLGLDARAILWLAAGLIVACQLLVLLPGHPHEAAHRDDVHVGAWQAMRRVPALVALAFAGGVFEAGLNAIGAAHASSTGLRLGVAATVAGAIGIGSFLCQYPAGWAADRFAPRRVFATAAVLLLGASAAIAAAERAPWLLWVCGLVWGGVGGALYTLAMIQVAHHFSGRATGGGTAAVITGYTVGGALGPLTSGAALQGAGLVGLAVTLACVALAALLAAGRLPMPSSRSVSLRA
jgi:MFS family permease